MLQHPLHVFRRVHVRPRRLDAIGDADFQAILQRPELLELLRILERRRRPRREAQQRAHAIGVDADVPTRAGE